MNDRCMIEGIHIGLSKQSSESMSEGPFGAFELTYPICSLPESDTLQKYRKRKERPVWRIILEDIEADKRYFELPSWSVFVNALRPGVDALILSCERSCEYDPRHLQLLENPLEAIYPVRCFLEFEHHSWSKAAKELASARYAVVQHDAPELPGIVKDIPTRSKHRLLRLLGRNKRTWFEHLASERFEYHYQLSELREIANQVRMLRDDSDSVTVILATYPAAAAIESARTLTAILSR